MSNEDNDQAFNTEALSRALAEAMKSNSASIKVNTKTLETVTVDNHKSIKTFLLQYTELTTTNQISDTDHKCRNLALEPIARNIHWEFKGKNLYSGETSVSNSKPFNWQNWPTDKLSQALLTAYPLESASSSANPEDRFTDAFEKAQV